VVQTGSNFGSDVRQENPFLATIGSGTMVADGLSIINADFSSTSFRATRVTVAERSFLGNQIAYHSQVAVGGNVLIGTKTMLPSSGGVRENVGLLGAPSFEIPRSVERDVRMNRLSRVEQRHRLAAKNRHNLVTIALAVFVRWFYLVGVLVLDAAAAEFYLGSGSEIALAVSPVVTLLFTVLYWTLVERLVTGLRDLQPRYCSILDRDFWRHERYWKMPSPAFVQLFNGTPFKGWVWRLMGVKVGRRLFDDGATLTERTLVTVGDDCTFNLGANIQSHSQEDGIFKSDRCVIGDGVTLGVSAFVHYGTTLSDGAVLESHSFLMKGEELSPHSRWVGNPAVEIESEYSMVTVASAILH
jgi:non-ribosomal peptide synthetase-like protein